MTEELTDSQDESIDEFIVFNGINGRTGQPTKKSLSELTGLIIDESKSRGPEQDEEAELLKEKLESQQDAHLGLSPMDEKHDDDLKWMGWGIVFHTDEDPAVKAALQPLIKHRREQIGDSKKGVLLETDYRTGENYVRWVTRHRVAPVNVDPKKVPYYLLLVGSPEKIPFSFGYQLDLDYCVGRLDFNTAAEYERYVQSVIEYETAGSIPNAKEAVFFGTRHPLDKATNISANMLIKPLTEGVPSDGTEGVASQNGFRQRRFLGSDAKKAALAEALHPGAGAPPAFLFTATHGVKWELNDPLQLGAQGALLCQDWVGGLKNPPDPPKPEHYFAASDLTSDARVHGLISFNFACYGAGTPTHDRFPEMRIAEKAEKPGKPVQIAEKAFLAALPQALLAHPKGGALACIGHVERAWGCSIMSDGTGVIRPFENAITRIMMGQPVGLALKDFNDKYMNTSTRLLSLLENINKFGDKVSPNVLVNHWTERNDAESYVVIGDPAVRLRVDDLK